jgi:sugar phosphate isomerase/epimerase
MVWQRAFSTLGCSRLPLADVARMARDGGWDGLELRAAPGEPVHVDLPSEQREGARRALADANVIPLAVASYVDLDDSRSADSEVRANLLAHVRLASDIGASFVRIFPGGPSADEVSIRRLTALASDLADFPDVAIGLETHDSRARGEDVARVLAQVGHPRIRAIWDVQHPFRAGEPVAETARVLAPFLGYVQITDARSMDDCTPCSLGTGVLPLREVYAELQSIGYEGWVSLEWASYWYAGAPPLADGLESAERWFSGSL